MGYAPIYPLSKIAANYNNTLGLVAWETILVTGDTQAFFPPVVYGGYSVGQERVRGDGTSYFSGRKVAHGQFGVITQNQFYYLQVTYCNGGYTGFVTVEIRTEDPNNYHTWNAILKLPQWSEVKKQSQAISPFPFLLRRLQFIA